MFRPHPGKDQRGILSQERRREKNAIPIAQTAPKPGAKEKGGYREDTAGEGGERKNSTGRRSLAQASPGIAKQKGRIPKKPGPIPKKRGPIPKKRGQIPTAARRPAIHDQANARRYSRTSQNGCGIGFQHSEVEERDGYQDACERRARTQKPQPPQGAQKSWAEVVRSGQVVSWDQC